MKIPTIRLRNGEEMPMFGFGTYFTDNSKCMDSVLCALKSGYRMLDTAAWYNNIELVAEAIKKSKIKRENIYITYKVLPGKYQDIVDDVFKTMDILDTTYLDLVLIHWPYQNVMDSYHALEDLYNAGIVKAIGVSNYDHILLEKVIKLARFKPAVNQIETHIYFQETKMHKYLEEKDIVHESWAPFAEGYLGLLEDKKISEIAKKYNKTNAQIILRFLIQKNIVVIPKSTNKNHIKENIKIFDFELEEKDMKKIEKLDKKQQYSNWPDNMAIETIY